ncbi:hypothetical protein BaRGS_00018490, partial [Batillaria attramentaria]
MGTRCLELLLALSLVCCILSPSLVLGSDSLDSGITWKSFQGIHDVQEVECSGSPLPQDADVMTMILYEGGRDYSRDTTVAVLTAEAREVTPGVHIEGWETEGEREPIESVDSMAEQSKGKKLEPTSFVLWRKHTTMRTDAKMAACWLEVLLSRRLTVVSVVFILISASQAVDNGLTSKLFRGFHNVQEIECSGAPLPTGSSLYALVLFEKSSDKVLSLADFSKKQCTTSENFVSCNMDETDFKKSTLRALVVNLAEGESRVYGCNASILTPGGRFSVISWSLTVHQRRLTSRPFLGFHDIQEIQCSGETLPSDAVLFSMVLFRKLDDEVLAFANLPSRECATSKSYVACYIDGSDSKKSNLKALVADLNEGESRTGHNCCGLLGFRKVREETPVVSTGVRKTSIRRHGVGTDCCVGGRVFSGVGLRLASVIQ